MGRRSAEKESEESPMINSGRLYGTTALHTAIRGIRSNSPTFKTVEFRQGFNVILAERTKESTKKDSRNGLGKSTLIEIISFCLGAKPEKTCLGCDALSNWSFTLDMELRGHPVSVTRSTKD